MVQGRNGTPWIELTHFLGVKRDLVGLMAMAIFVGLGERMAERFLPIYILALGGGAVSVGLLNSLDNLLSALYSFPGGYIADRFGTKRALLFFNLLAISGYLVVIAFPSWWAVVAGSVLFLSWTAISLSASMKLIASVLPKNKRAMGVTMHSLVRRIPMALGPVIGGTMIGIFGEVQGVRAAFGGAFLWKVSPTLNLWTAFACGVLGTAWFVLWGTDQAPKHTAHP